LVRPARVELGDLATRVGNQLRLARREHLLGGRRDQALLLVPQQFQRHLQVAHHSELIQRNRPRRPAFGLTNN
jgi:hypothetical protein